jgi:hypothetical protein
VVQFRRYIIVLEDDTDRLADLGAKNRTENSGVLPLRGAGFEVGECFIGVFAVKPLKIHETDQNHCG